MEKVKLLEVKKSKVLIQANQDLLVLEVKKPGIVRFILNQTEKYPDSPLGIINENDDLPQWEIKQTDRAIILTTDRIVFEINKQTSLITWRDNKGNLLLNQPFPEIYSQDVIRYSTGDEDPVIRRVKTVDGERNFVENLAPYVDRSAFRSKVFFDWQDDESIHGLGQGEEGIYNYRGKVQYMYQHNMRIPLPFLLSNKGYGVLFDCGSLMTFNDDERGSYLFLDTVDMLDFYFIYGEKVDEIIKGFRHLTGEAVLPPKWAFGYIQSKEAYQNQDELLEVAKEYRRRRIPLDCVVQDWNTWEPGLWGNKRLDKSRFPNILATNKALHHMNVHSMISVWPNMNMGGEDYQEFVDNKHMLGDNATYDAFNPDARRIYWNQANKELFSGGFDSWWCDSTEPFSGPDWGGEVLREPWEKYSLVGGEHKKYLDPSKANLYALAHAKGIYENQRKENPNKRVLNLTRSGSAGSQKYGTVLWSGDISATWSTMEKQITEGLNVAISGMPWWTLDIGGFFTVKDKWQNRGCGNHNNPNPLWFWKGDYNEGVKDLGYRELYTRWLQLGTFLPMFRSHGTDTPREIWQFGEPGEMFYDVIEKYIRLRYQLMPYVYSLAGQVAIEGFTMMRSLLFDFINDPNVKEISNQFMFGDSLLVCPVTKPMYYKAESQEIINSEKTWLCYLPKGADWYNFWTGQYHQGGQNISVQAPLDIMPIFVKAGSIIPIETAQLEYASQTTDEPLEIKVWPGADAHFVLYEDSGDGYAYEKGKYNQIVMTWEEKSKKLNIGSAKFDFPQSMNGRKCIVKVGEKEVEFNYNGKKVEFTF